MKPRAPKGAKVMTRRADAPGLLDQFQVVLFATKDKRLTACDIAVLAEIVDRFLKDEGVETRCTGLGHLARETGRARSSVKDSVDKLIEIGYLDVVTDFTGTAGRTFHPNFDWARDVDIRIRVEVNLRKTAKQNKVRKAVSVPAPAYTNEDPLVYPRAGTLRALVCPPDGTVGSLLYPHAGTETYVEPTGSIRMVEATTAFGCEPTQGASSFKVKIVGQEHRVVPGERYGEEGYLFLDLLYPDGEVRESRVCFLSNSPSVQDVGQQQMSWILEACGLDEFEEDMPANFLVGVDLTVDQNGDIAKTQHPWDLLDGAASSAHYVAGRERLAAMRSVNENVSASTEVAA